MQDCNNFSVLAVKLLQSCTEPLIVTQICFSIMHYSLVFFLLWYLLMEHWDVHLKVLSVPVRHLFELVFWYTHMDYMDIDVCCSKKGR